MRSLMVGVAVAAMAWSGGAACKSSGARPVRSVQLITMNVPAPEPQIRGTGEAAAESGAVEAAPLPPEFRVHDLSRQWVAFQMANSFSGGNVAAYPAAIGDSAGLVADAVDGLDGRMPPPPAIPVPLWMRGGAVFASAATQYEPGCAAVPYRPTGFLKADAENRRASYYRLMSGIACEHGIPVGLFDAMIIRESRYRTDALSPKNAFGLTQLMPGTAALLGVNRYSVEGNLRGGAKYLRQQLDTFGQYHLALAAYNAGPGRVRGGRVPRIAETQAYVGNVLGDWARLSGVYRQATLLPQAGTRVVEAASPPQGRRAKVSLF